MKVLRSTLDRRGKGLRMRVICRLGLLRGVLPRQLPDQSLQCFHGGSRLYCDRSWSCPRERGGVAGDWVQVKAWGYLAGHGREEVALRCGAIESGGEGYVLFPVAWMWELWKRVGR